MPSLPQSDSMRRGKGDRRLLERMLAIADARDAGARAIRRTSRWTKVSAWVRREFPVCADPLGHHAADGRVVASEQVHHRIPVRDRPDLAFEPSNLVALCTRCHAQLESRDD